jgi:hypothetical protein
MLDPFIIFLKAFTKMCHSNNTKEGFRANLCVKMLQSVKLSMSGMNVASNGQIGEFYCFNN